MCDLIKVDNLVKTYEGFTLDHLSMEVPEGCVVGFVGSNGAGKTTTIKSILGLIRPDEGNVVLFGEPVCGFGARGGTTDAALAKVKARMGVVFDTCPFPRETLVSDVERIGRCTFPAWSRSEFERLVRDFGIDTMKKVGDLSRGMGMKLQLAFALAHEPELLILDEVTAGLDPIARGEVLDILRDFMGNDHRGILISSHITSDLEKVADYVLCIDEGRTVFSCAVDEICDIAGVARCGSAQLGEIANSGVFAPGGLRVVRDAYSCDVLVPDRALLAKSFPHIVCERVSIEDYMRLMLKGEIR